MMSRPPGLGYDGSRDDLISQASEQLLDSVLLTCQQFHVITCRPNTPHTTKPSYSIKKRKRALTVAEVTLVTFV